MKLYKRFDNSDLFFVYFDYDRFQKQHHQKAMLFADESELTIFEVAREYFHSKNHERGGRPEDLICTKMARNVHAGTRNAILIGVKMCGEKTITKYQIKYHHFAGKFLKSGQNPSGVDMKEVFCYKLLEVMGIDPRMQLVYSTQSLVSKTARYATI